MANLQGRKLTYLDINLQARRKKSNYGGSEIRFISIYNSAYNLMIYAYNLTFKMIWRNFFIKNFFYGGGHLFRPPYIPPCKLAYLNLLEFNLEINNFHNVLDSLLNNLTSVILIQNSQFNFSPKFLSSHQEQIFYRLLLLK